MGVGSTSGTEKVLMSLRGGQLLPFRTCSPPPPPRGREGPAGGSEGPGAGLVGVRGQALTVAVALTALTFREEQCAAYNHRPDLFKSFPGPLDWVPRYVGVAARDQCKLTCQARALGYYYVLEPRVSRDAGLPVPHSACPSAFFRRSPLWLSQARPAASPRGPLCSRCLENRPQLRTTGHRAVQPPPPPPAPGRKKGGCGLWGRARTLSYGLLRRIPVVLLSSWAASLQETAVPALALLGPGWRLRGRKTPQSALCPAAGHSYRLAAL